MVAKLIHLHTHKFLYIFLKSHLSHPAKRRRPEETGQASPHDVLLRLHRVVLGHGCCRCGPWLRLDHLLLLHLLQLHVVVVHISPILLHVALVLCQIPLILLSHCPPVQLLTQEKLGSLQLALLFQGFSLTRDALLPQNVAAVFACRFVGCAGCLFPIYSAIRF